MTACVDASVVAKWYFDEELSDRARVLERAYEEGHLELAAPDVLFYECMNILRGKAYEGQCTADEASRIAQRILGVRWQLVPGPVLAERALRLCLQRGGLVVYDAAYVALAAALGVDFWTADVRLARLTADLPFVKLLGRDWFAGEPTSGMEEPS